MSAKYFIDTNIFVYSFDNRSPWKKARAQELIRSALENGDGVISTRVVQEFLNVATRKFVTPMEKDDSKNYLRIILNPLCQIYPSIDLYELGLELQAEVGFSFYDSLILAAAIEAGCESVVTEDLQDGQNVRGVMIKNPFGEISDN